MKKLTLVILGLIALLIGVVAAAVYQLNLPTTGNILAETNLTLTPTSINWGDFTPTVSNTSMQYITITNTGTATITITSITAPDLTVGTLYENITGITLTPTQSTIANFTLVIDTMQPQTFNFDIIIGA